MMENRRVYVQAFFLALFTSGILVSTSSFIGKEEVPSINEEDSHILQVEDGIVEHPMLIKTDDYALGGQFVEVEAGNKSSSEPPSQGKVTLEVTLTGGTYTIWGRTIALDDDSDSFWIQVNNGEVYNWNDIPITPYWGWSQVEDFRYREVVNWTLPAGTHTITLYYREPDTRIDALFITNTETVPTEGDDDYPPNLVSLKSPPIPWQNAYNFTLPNFEFEHPMTVINNQELTMIKHYIEHQVEPQYSAYLQFIDEAEESQSFVPDAPATMNIMGGYEPNSNLNEVREQLWRNCHAAYSSGLAYQLTGESRFADKAIEVMMDWANANTTFTGGDRGLQLGSWFSQVLYAADLIYDYDGWTEEQRTTFKSWWRNNVLIHTQDVLRGKDNNWKDAALLGVFTASVVLEDTVILKEALIHLKSYFYERVDESVRNPGVDWKMRKDEHGVYLPREVVRNDGRSGLTYTAYAMTTMVQCLDIAKYAGFNMWDDSTAQGSDITQVIETYFQWDIKDQSFPWNSNPNKSDKRRNAYELANINLDLSDEVVTWIENNRPQVAREGDEYATLTKGDIHLSKLEVSINLEDNQAYNPGDEIPLAIEVADPFQVGIDQVEIILNGEVQSAHGESSISTSVNLPTTDTAVHQIQVKVTDGFGVVREENYTALNSNKAKKLNLGFNSTWGSIAVVPEQNYYSPGQEVSITAVAKFPYEFINWSGDDTSSISELSLTMNDDFSLEAVFQLRANPRLNVNFQPRANQSISGYESDKGDAFKLSNSIKSGWRVDEVLNGIRRLSNTIWDQRKLSYIQMQQGTDEGNSWELELANGFYNIEVGFGDPSFLNHLNSFNLEDELVTDPDGKDAFDIYTFEGYEISDGYLTISPAGENVKINYLKVAPADLALTKFLAVDGGTGEGEYQEGEQVSISATPPTGTDVFEWVGDISSVEDFENHETTVVMPSTDVQLQASYLPTFTLTIENGSGEGNYKEGVVVTISAVEFEDRPFTRWTGDTQFLEDATSPSTTLEMPNQAVSIAAEYESVLGIGESLEGFTVYPNPTIDHATLEFELTRPSELIIEIMDLAGKNISSQTRFFNAGRHLVALNSELVTGVNVIRIQKDTQTVTYLLVKQ